MLVHLDEITDFVTTNNLSFTEGLHKLSSYEVDFKEKNVSKSMIKAAAFPFVKELKDFDFSFKYFPIESVKIFQLLKTSLNFYNLLFCNRFRLLFVFEIIFVCTMF